MYQKGIAGTSGAAPAQHDQTTHESSSRQPHSAPPAGAHSVRTTDSRLSALSARRDTVPTEIRESDSDSDSDESETSSLYQGVPSSRFGSERMRVALGTDFPSMRVMAPPRRSDASLGETSARRGQAQTETQTAPSGGERPLTASLYGRAAELGAKATGMAASGLAAARDGVVATASGGARVLGAGLRHAAQAGTSAVSGLGVIHVSPKLIGAAAGHLMHQTAATGLTTFAREMLYEALAAALRQLPQPALTAMQITSGVTQVGLQRLRQAREQRNPEAAARGYHNLSAEQWAALPAEEKQAKMAQQRAYSDAVTSLAAVAAITNVAMSLAGPGVGRPELPAQLLATDIKALAYAGARDSIQTMLQMVNTEVPAPGVRGAPLNSAAEFYAKMNLIGNYSYGAVPAGLGDARTKLAAVFGDEAARAALATHPSPLSTAQAIGTIAHSSAVKATINTLVETSDWINLTQVIANEAGTQQRFEPALNPIDLPAALDKGIARLAAVSSNISLGSALSMAATALHAPPWLNSLLANGGPAILAGQTYNMIVEVWDGGGEVRREANERASEQEARAGAAEPRGDENV
jgi:hypothetical protein